MLKVKCLCGGRSDMIYCICGKSVIIYVYVDQVIGSIWGVIMSSGGRSGEFYLDGGGDLC